jgi:penicillin-binding protein 2
MFGEDDLVKTHKGRADQLANIVLLCFLIILSRLWFLQVYKGKQFYFFSLENRLRKDNISAPRGMIFSRTNDLLVHNVPRFDAIVTPQYLKNKKETFAKLASVLDMTVPQIERIITRSGGQASYIPIAVKKNLTPQEVAVIETENSKMPGVTVTTFISREYSDKEVGSHVLGYISEISPAQLPRYRSRDKYNYKLGDFIGQAGLEEQLDLTLRGDDGYEYVEVDARGRLKRHFRNDALFGGEIENKMAQPGQNLRLTIDRDMQLTAFNALEGRAGSAVAVDVHSGEVLTMVSRPSYDPGQFSRGLTPEYWASLTGDERNPLRDRTVQEHYSPGSTFKAITAIAALEEGIVDERTEVNCNGSFQLGRRKFHCWKKHGHGKVNLVKSLSESCDVYYYKIGATIDIDVLAKYATAFGFGSRTGIALPRETTGLIPTKEWKRKKTGQEWQKGETLSCVIGQSFVLTTPLQLAMSYSAIANGGKLYKPHLVKETFTNSGEILKKSEPEVSSEVKISEKTLRLVRKGLIDVVNQPGSTAYWHRGQGIHMAGKTGTSQVMSFSADKLFSKCDEKEYKHRHHALFAAYAPYDDPQIAVGVVVEHGCSGSGVAAPIAQKIVTTYMKKFMPEKHQEIIAHDKKAAPVAPKPQPKRVDEDDEVPESPIDVEE